MILLIFIFHTFGSFLALPFDQDSIAIQNLEFTIIENNGEFPKSFSLSVNEQGHKLEGQFEIVQNQASPPMSVYENGQVRLVEFSNFDKHQVYKEKNGRGFATLIQNKFKIENSHRVFARIFPDNKKNNHYDIFHVLKRHARLGHLTYQHLLNMKNFDNEKMNSTMNLKSVHDFKLVPEGKIDLLN